MLSVRSGAILKCIVDQYIKKAVPVSSQCIVGESDLGVSSATIRNEVANLEQAGYIIRPHTSAGSIPSDGGYRYYVESLGKPQLSPAEQCLISHLLHQVEQEVEKWVSLTATLLAQLVHNVAVVTVPKSVDCKFKHMELLALQDTEALLVLVLHGAQVRQKLITFEQTVAQPVLTVISNKLNADYPGMTRRQILAKDPELSTIEQQVRNHLVDIMQQEDKREFEEPYLDGLHFIINQPEFAYSNRMQPLIELVEQRNLLKSIIPRGLQQHLVHVVIGKENETEAIQNYSVVISQYGLPDEATGAIGVVGPTRMPYAHVIPAVEYLSLVLSKLVAGLYGREYPPDAGKIKLNKDE